MDGTFDFSEYGFNGTFIDPVISNVPRSEVRMNETQMMIDAAVYLTGAEYNICVPLTDIVVADFNYDQDQLIDRVTTRLQDFKV